MIEMYLSIGLLYLIAVATLYRNIQLEHKIKQMDIDHKKSLADAGNAITDTLKVAFDNLKRNSNEHTKINGKMSEHNSRIHRLEQHLNRTVREKVDKEDVGSIEQDKLKKVKSKYENEQ